MRHCVGLVRCRYQWNRNRINPQVSGFEAGRKRLIEKFSVERMETRQWTGKSRRSLRWLRRESKKRRRRERKKKQKKEERKNKGRWKERKKKKKSERKRNKNEERYHENERKKL